MFYTITGEFVNNKKKIIERFSDEEKVHIINTTPSGEEKILQVEYNGSEFSMDNVTLTDFDLDNKTVKDLSFTVKSKNGVKYLIAEKVKSRSGVVTTSEIDELKTMVPTANLMLVFCFSPKRFAHNKVPTIFCFDMAYEDSDTITQADRTALADLFIPSIDELIEDELIINNLNTSYFSDKKTAIKTSMETEIDAVTTPGVGTKTKDSRKQTGNALLGALANADYVNMRFVSHSGEDKKVLDDVGAESTVDSTADSTAVAASGDDVDSQEQITDYAQRYNQMRLNMCTKPEVFCPPGYKCIPSDSWNTLLEKVDTLDSNLEKMNILDGDK